MANDIWSWGELHGNSNIIMEIRDMANIANSKHISLHETQADIKKYLSGKYGTEWYRQSAEAVQYIIEDIYSSSMRYKEMGNSYLNPISP